MRVCVRTGFLMIPILIIAMSSISHAMGSPPTIGPPSLSVPVGSNVSVGVPAKTLVRGEENDVATPEAWGPRIGFGVKPIAVLALYGGEIDLFFNKEHGLAFQYLAGPGFFTKQDMLAMAVYYTKMVSYTDQVRRYLSVGYALGGLGLKYGVENGDYNGGNWTFEIGYPVIIGFGYIWYI